MKHQNIVNLEECRRCSDFIKAAPNQTKVWSTEQIFETKISRKRRFTLKTSIIFEWQGYKCVFFIKFSEKNYIHDFPLKTKKWLI